MEGTVGRGPQTPDGTGFWRVLGVSILYARARRQHQMSGGFW